MGTITNKIRIPVAGVGANRAASVWHRSVRASKWSKRARIERAENGRISYAMAALGLRLIAGIFTPPTRPTAGVGRLVSGYNHCMTSGGGTSNGPGGGNEPLPRS